VKKDKQFYPVSRQLVYSHFVYSISSTDLSFIYYYILVHRTVVHPTSV